ncbi:hypothetical protein LTR50_006810 [Elasticomyces elasticus]|nr:hypothetical protein LTR50_006810 [Elasticomyces elasticus]
MAIETRVHSIWNNLIESASHATGSLLIWDTGSYEVLPRRKKAAETDDELSDNPSNVDSRGNRTPSNTELVQAFRNHHIRLRLHGTRLPADYSIVLRLAAHDAHAGQPRKPKHKRRRRDPALARKLSTLHVESDSEGTSDALSASAADQIQADQAALASEDDEDEEIRKNNAYPGAENSIGSIHQRHWFLTLDKENSGFRRVKDGSGIVRWERRGLPDGSLAGWDPFFVLGREVERSVVTGRTAADVMADEGVKAYAGRKMWRPVTE